jgi:hypothetical protein
MLRDLFNHIEIRRVLSPGAGPSDTTPQVGQIIDHQNARSSTYVLQTGTLADADATSVVLLEEGEAANLSDATAVADSDLLGTELAAAFRFDDDDNVRKLGYRGAKRYTRLTVTPVANTGAMPMSACCIIETSQQPAPTQADT